MFLYQCTLPQASGESDVQEIAQLLRQDAGTMAVIAQGMQSGVDPDTMTPGYNPYGWIKFYSTVAPPEIGFVLGGYRQPGVPQIALYGATIAQIPR